MKIIRFLFTIVLACVLTLNASAQDNGLNPVYKVQLGEITYQKGEASKKEDWPDTCPPSADH